MTARADQASSPLRQLATLAALLEHITASSVLDGAILLGSFAHGTPDAAIHDARHAPAGLTRPAELRLEHPRHLIAELAAHGRREDAQQQPVEAGHVSFSASAADASCVLRGLPLRACAPRLWRPWARASGPAKTCKASSTQIPTAA